MSKHHHETHSHHTSATLSDFVLGMSDGLTVPFALAAGLAGAVDSSNLIVTAGVAEIAAGVISMGLGGYMAVKTAHDHYASEERREYREVEQTPHIEEKEVADIFIEYGIPKEQVHELVKAISVHPKKWVDFMMKFELGLEPPDPRRLFQSPLVIGGAYALGGFVPLLPYIVIHQSVPALKASVIISLVALAIFGAFKGRMTGQNMLKSSFQTTIIGAVAAAAAFSLARLVS
jgi:VIT1/CCC1 family predicted Fe2+/Mn2+ transporter